MVIDTLISGNANLDHPAASFLKCMNIKVKTNTEKKLKIYETMSQE